MNILFLLKSMGVTLRNFFRKPVTVMYPDKTRKIPERFRGPLFVLTRDNENEENCIACRLCEMICPSKIIKVVPSKEKSPKTQRQYPEIFTLRIEACLACELCVQVCPQDAILMVRIPGWAANNRDELFLTKEKMYEYFEKYKDRLSVSTGNYLREMQAPPRKTPAQEIKEAK